MVAFDSDVFAAPLWLSDALTGPAAAVGLPQFAQVAHITFLTCLASFTLQRISHTFCPKLFPKYYPTLKPKQDDWDLHVVGWAYSLIATPLAISQILTVSPELIADPLFGFSINEARLSALATGYFIWDAYVSAQHIKTQGLGFFMHGSLCAVAFACTLSPFLLFCAPNFLVWEISTVFLNLHWYLDKFGMTGSTFQLINGAFLLAAYIGGRLIWGTYQSYVVISLLFGPKGGAKIGNLRFVYGGINLMLNALNFFWFRSMVLALRKRFVKAAPGARNEVIAVDGKLRWGKDKKVE